MKLNFLYTLLTLLMITSNFKLVHASVWESTQEWNSEFEEKFSKWIESNSVHPQLFTSPQSPYSGVSVDCADVMYSLRAIFAYENKLPYQVKNPVATARSKTQFFTNQMSLWDNLPESQRIKRFLTYLTSSLGTETLSLFDSYSPTIKSIKSGSFFMWKVVLSTGEIVRHTYVIKNINAKGNYDLMYSTQSASASNRPMYYHPDVQISSVYAPKKENWGYRKMKWPIHYTQGNLPADFSNEQYALAAKLSGKDFFRYVKRTLQKVVETNDEYMERTTKSLCAQLVDREVEVNTAVNFVNGVQQRCTNYQEYDAYSTPSRDLAFKTSYQELKEFYQDLIKFQEVETLAPLNLNKLKFILGETVDTQTTSQNLGLCSIKFSWQNSMYEVNLRSLYNSFSQGKVSFHPNDNIARRWGFLLGTKTNCKTWYGQN